MIKLTIKQSHLPFLILVSLLFINTTLSAQQLPHRNELGQTDFLLNPASTAVGEYLEFGATYRKQWADFENAPTTITAYLQLPLIYSNMSLGGALTQDKTGPLEKNEITLTYSYKLKTGLFYHDQLSIGLLADIAQHRINGNNAVVTNEQDPLILQAKSSTIQSNFGFGLFYVSNKKIYNYEDNGFYFGVASNQLLPQDLTFSENESGNLRQVIHANAVFGARFNNDLFSIEPSIWAQYTVQNIFLYSGGLRFEMIDIFWTELRFSSNIATSLQAGITLDGGILKDGSLRLGVLATRSIGNLSTHLGNGYEFVMAYRFGL